MIQNTFVKILIILVVVTTIFMLWQLFTDPFDAPEKAIRERAIPKENYYFLDNPLFENLKSFDAINPIEINKTGRENPFNVY